MNNNFIACTKPYNVNAHRYGVTPNGSVHMLAKRLASSFYPDLLD